MFQRRADALRRRVVVHGHVIASRIRVAKGPPSRGPQNAIGAWWESYLRGRSPQPATARGRPLRIADLFCGAGGLALGVKQLAAEAGRSAVWDLVIDSDPGAVATFAANHDVRVRETRSVTSLVDYHVRSSGSRASFSYAPEILNEHVATATSGLDLVTAGPPCQGHSTLNNRSRGRDRRNYLMLSVAAFAVAAKTPRVIIENVPRVVRDAGSVVDTTRALFLSQGYRLTEGVLAADEMGWPQTRRRYFMVACRGGEPLPIEQVRTALAAPDGHEASVSWLLDLVREERATGRIDAVDTATEHSGENRVRINWLFDNDAYDLPDRERPRCHRDGTTYRAVYGRMRPDRPAPTITTGFTSPGRGRFVHPTERRTLTPREASVIQGFPLDYRFIAAGGGEPSRSQLAKWIGDAVPMPLGYAAALSAFGGS